MLFDWFFPDQAKRREERYSQASAATREAQDFIADVKDALAALQETADEDRKGYPVASALQRPRQEVRDGR